MLKYFFKGIPKDRYLSVLSFYLSDTKYSLPPEDLQLLKKKGIRNCCVKTLGLTGFIYLGYNIDSLLQVTIPTAVKVLTTYSACRGLSIRENYK